MNWLQRIFHEPPDPEIGTIQRALKAEEKRHSEKVDDINEALSDLERTRRLAEGGDPS